MKSSTNLGAVQSPTINGVKLSRHALTIEAGRLNAIARQVGFRLRQWFRVNVSETQLPDAAEVLPYFKWYSDVVLGLLKEHRARAGLKPEKGGMPLTDEEFERALLAELAELQAKREKSGAVDVPSSSGTHAEAAATPEAGMFDFGEGGEE